MLALLAALAPALTLAVAPQEPPTLIADLATAPSSSIDSGEPFSIRGAALGLLWMDGRRENVASRAWVLPASGAEPQPFTIPGSQLAGLSSTELRGVTDLGTGRALIGLVTLTGFPTKSPLFVTDGTSAGTVNTGIQLAGGFTPPGRDDAYPVVENGVAYLRGVGANGVAGVYRTDGTVAGTALLAPVTNASNAHLWKVGDQLIGFETNQAGSNSETTLFSVPAAGGALQPLVVSTQVSPIDARVVGGRLVFGFRGDPASEAQFGAELWSTDGTLANTSLLVDLAPGVTSSLPMMMASDGAVAFFSAFTTATGRELWTTDGTPAGTALVAELAPGAISGVPATAESNALLGANLVFRGSADGQSFDPWFSDGTAAGTRQIANPSSANGGSLPFDFFGTPFYALDGLVGFGGVADGAGREPCVTDGVTVTLLGDLEPGPVSSKPKDFAAFDGRTFFAADLYVGGFNPWSAAVAPLDLVQEVTIDKTQLNESSRPQRFVAGAGRGFFTTFPISEPSTMYVTDGTTAGTVAIESPGAAVGTLDERVIYFADSEEFGFEAYITDGTPLGGTLLADLRPGPQDGADPQLGGAQLGRYFYFSARTATSGYELARTDGTTAGTEIFAQFAPGNTPGIAPPFSPLVFADRLFFEAAAPPSGIDTLWATNGEQGGTFKVAQQELGGKFVAGFAPLRDDLAVGVYQNGTYEIYTVSVGSSNADLRHSGSGALTDLSTVGARVVFSFFPGGTSLEALGSVDVQGNYELLIPPVPASMGMTLLGTASNGVYVSVLDSAPGVSGTWFTDGTAAGTLRIGEWGTRAMPAGSGVEMILNIADPSIGEELWVSDGTLAGTRLIADIVPGFGSSDPRLLGTAGNRFLFAATTPELGEELHGIDLADADAFLARPFGQGCGSGSDPSLAVVGELRVGNTVELELSGLAPGVPAGVYASLSVASGAQGECAVYLPGPLPVGLVLLDGQGESSVPFAVPAEPALVGLKAYLQGVAAVAGGPLLGSFELTHGVELVFGP